MDPRKVLIVEDVQEMRDILIELVNGIPGFAVSGAAGNSWEARLEITRRKPDLVLLDEILPGVSSADILAEFRRVKLPVILVTGAERVKPGLPEGAIARLTKPDWKRIVPARPEYEKAFRAALGLDP